MGPSAKILFLSSKQSISQKTIVQGSGKNITEYPSEREVEYLKNKAIVTLKKIEAMWEMNHDNLEIRDHLHLLSYYLKKLF